MTKMSGDGGKVSRPCSLLLDTTPPEREPLSFDVQLVGAPPEVEQLVNNIKQVAEDFLYHWKTFPIVLPQSRFTGPGNKLSDIIIAPPCDELDAAALDAGVEPLPLSSKQLHSIREKGEFEVPSRHFPGQTHVWRVAGWLQRGRVRARDELYEHIARAATLILVVARDRLLKREPVSLITGAEALLDGLHRLIDLIIGMPSLEARDLDKKIREERSRYLVAELICKPEQQEDVSGLAAWVSRALRRAACEKCEAPRPPPRVPCLYTTPQRTQVDLRLYRRDLLRRAASTLQNILDRESRGWFLHFRERHAAQLAGQKMPIKDIEEEVRAAAMREYVSRVCSAVLASELLRALGPDVPELLAAQLRASAILTRAEESVRRKVEAARACAEARVRAAHPVLSRAAAWRRERVMRAVSGTVGAGVDTQLAAREDAAAALLAHKLHQHRYFLLRDIAFLRDREPLLMKELRAAKTPTRSFSWATRIWCARQWVVTRHFRGRAERIPAVVSARATSIVTPRSDPSQPVFLVHKERVRTTTTRWTGWRAINLAHRTWCWSWNMMFVLGVMVPWCSPLSLRTLIRIKPFVPDYELSQVNGTLFPKRSSETQTMWSRLLLLWRHVSKERTRFETEPDTGLLGKGLSRQVNRLLNYGVVGGLGSLGLLLLFPLVALLASALSLAAAVTVPLWMPVLTLLVHVGNALIYEIDCPEEPSITKRNRWFVLLEVLVWRIGVLGLLQPLLALLVALVLCPLGALALVIGGVSWWSCRGVWEECMWRGVVARAGRVPAHDSAFCRRVRGPGLHTPTYYQITGAQALAALSARGELDALAAWAARTDLAIDAPLADYAHFVQACFGPFSVTIAKTGAYKQLEKECSELKASLREKVAARQRDLALGLSDSVRTRVRLSKHDLRRAVQSGAAELCGVWAGAGRGGGGDEWWAARGLDAGQWHALAANTLVEVFDSEILSGLEEGEARVPLENGEGAQAWAAKCGPRDTAPPDVLAEREDWRHTECSESEWSEWGEWVEWGGSAARGVRAPTLELAAFTPRAPLHPPVPAPALVALVLHNRDSDNPVPLDSELCAEILKTLEDAPDSIEKRETVERYRGGGSDAGSSSDTSAASVASVASLHPQHDELAHDHSQDEEACRMGRVESGAGGVVAACRWTLAGRGARVRVRADLASPEDVSLDAERPAPHHRLVGTSV